MLNFSQDQIPALSRGKRRVTEPPSTGDSTDIIGRPANRARLASPEQEANGVPRPITKALVLAVRGPAQQLLAAPDAPGHVGKTSASTKVHADVDRQVECLARQVCDAQQLALDSAIFVIRKTNLESPENVADWLQLCAMLCLHYDAQKDKEPLWQCLERLLLRINVIHQPGNGVLYDAVATSLLATSTTGGFIRILQRAIDNEWEKGVVARLFEETRMMGLLKKAFEQQAVGLHLKKTAQQAAAEFLLAHPAPPPACEPYPHVVPITAESIGWSDTTAHSPEGWARDSQQAGQDIDVSGFAEMV